MAMLDMPQFPHILSSVMSYCSWSTLITLRLVSKNVRTAVDTLQCTHLVLIDTDLLGTAVNVYAPGMLRIPALQTCSPISWSQQPVHPKAALVANTRVVDILGFVSTTCDLTLLAPHFKRLDTLRMPTCPFDGGFTPYFPVPAKTLVLFTNNDAIPNPIDMELRAFGGYDDYDEEPEVLPKGVRPSIPDGVTKVVVNMKGTDIPIADVHGCIMDAPKSVKEIVIILLKYTGRSLVGELQPGLMGEQIVSMDTAELISANKDVNFTLVGFDEIRASYPAKFRSLLANEMRAYNVKGIDQPGDNVVECNPFGPGPRRVIKSKYRPEKEAWIEGVLSKVTFKSIYEYARTCGRPDEEVHLDFVEH